MAEKPRGDFIPLSSLRPKGQDTKAILAEIRQIYFKTTRPTRSGKGHRKQHRERRTEP